MKHGPGPTNLDLKWQSSKWYHTHQPQKWKVPQNLYATIKQYNHDSKDVWFTCLLQVVCVYSWPQLQQCSKHGWTENTNISSQSNSLFCTALMTQLHKKQATFIMMINGLQRCSQSTIANNFETSYWNMMGMQTRQYQRHNILITWHVRSPKIFTSHVEVQHQRVTELVLNGKNCWICTVTYQMVQSSVLCKQNK
jgi:hypothetical protein